MMLPSYLGLGQEPQSQEPIGWSSQLPPAASTFAESHDALFYFTYYMCVFFFVLITLILLYSVVRYRRRTEDQEPASTLTHHTGLEVTWTVVPLILVMIIFGWGWQGMRDMVKAPANAKPYEVEGSRWSWRFKHPPPDGLPASPQDWTSQKVLYVVKDEPAVFNMRSKDVLHSFYIPAFRVKRDVLPGRYQRVWFTPTELGDFPVFCTEYCGDDHSKMTATVRVVTREEFGNAPWRVLPDHPWDRGKLFYGVHCASCHTLDGTKLTGPSFKDLYGNDETLADGTKVKVDADYIIESIREPQKKIVKGYENEAMTTFNDKVLPDEHVQDLILFMKSPDKKIDK